MAGVRPKRRFESWWATRWLGLTSLYRDTSRRASRRYFGHASGHPWSHFNAGCAEARAGSIHEPRVEGSCIRGYFHGEEAFHGYNPWLEVVPFPDKVWAQVFPALAARSQILAELLTGYLPVDIRDLFRDARVDLFPRSDIELLGGCNCDVPAPCVHLCALHYIAADALERDPFLLFELRGRPRARFLDELHQARRAISSYTTGGARGVSLAGITTDAYDALPARLPDILDPPPLPEDASAALRLMKSPADWSEKETPATLLAPLLDAASQQAHRLLVQPGKIRSLTPGLHAPDPRVLLAARLLEKQRSARVRPALACIHLALRSLRGDDTGTLLDDFSALLASPRGRIDAWWKLWIPAALREQPAVHLSLRTFAFPNNLAASALLALLPSGPSVLLWSPEGVKDNLRARTRARRRMLERINELVPEDREISLVASLEEGGDDFEAYLDLLGWSFVLQDGPDGAAIGSSPQALTLLERHTSAAQEPLFPLLPAETEAPFETTPAAADFDRILWLRVLGRELLGLLGVLDRVLAAKSPREPEQEPATDPARQGRQVYEELPAMKDARASLLLRSWADALEAHDAFKNLFAPLG